MNMKQINEREFNKARTSLSAARLPEAAKRAMLDRIYETAADAVLQPSPWSFSLTAFYRYTMAFGLAALLITGTAYAAAGSLPGDALYNVKTRVVEPLALAAHWSPERKDEYKIALLQRRIRELEALKASGRVSTESEYESHLAAQKNVTDIEQSPAFDQTAAKVEVSTYINSYNEIASDDLKLKTVIDLGTNVTSTTSTSSAAARPETPASSTIREPAAAVTTTVKETLDTTAAGAAAVVPTVTEPIKSVVAPAKETAAPVSEIVAPLIDRLGL